MCDPAFSKDPILNTFFRLLADEYGDDFDRGILFGSRAHGSYHDDDTYDIAIFLKKMKEKQAEIDRLDTLRLEMFYTFGAEFNLLPFSASDYQSKSGLVSALKKGGISFAKETANAPDAPLVNERIEEILSHKEVFCLSISVLALGNKRYPIEIGLANARTGDSRSWLIRNPVLSFNKYAWIADLAPTRNISRQQMIDDGLPPLKIITAMKEYLGRGAKVLSTAVEHDKDLLDDLCDDANISFSPFLVEDFNDIAWQIACAGPAPEISLYKSEIEALSRFPQHQAGPTARKDAEILRLVARYT